MQCGSDGYKTQLGPLTIDTAVKYDAVRVVGTDVKGTVGTSPCGCILHVRDSISSTQILNSFTSPVTLIAPPGSGYFVHPTSISYKYIYGSAAYSFGGVAGFFINSTTGSEVIAGQMQSILANTNSFFACCLSMGSGQVSTINNQPLIFQSLVSNPTTGNGYLIVLDYTIEKY